MYAITNRIQFFYVVKKIVEKRIANKFSLKEVLNVLVFETWKGKSIAKLSKYICEEIYVDKIIETRKDFNEALKHVETHKYNHRQLALGIALHPWVGKNSLKLRTWALKVKLEINPHSDLPRKESFLAQPKMELIF